MADTPEVTTTAPSPRDEILRMVLYARHETEIMVGPLMERAIADAAKSKSEAFKVTLTVDAKFDPCKNAWKIQTTGAASCEIKTKHQPPAVFIDVGPTLFDINE